MYKTVGSTITAIPREFTRVTLLPPEREDDILWRLDPILRMTNKSSYHLIECLWIPSMYLPPEERKNHEEILVLRNEGRCSDKVIPAMTVSYGGIEYEMNILNCKGTGVTESKLKERGESTFEQMGKFSVRNSVISRQEYNHGRPYGGVTAEAAMSSEVSDEQVMLDNGLPHAINTMVIRIPKEIQREIDEYNAENVYREYSMARFGPKWVDGDLAQVKRLFTTNLRMNFEKNRSFHRIVEENCPRLTWLEPKNLARLIGRCDGRYEGFLKELEVQGKVGDFFGRIRRNRTIDGLLVDGENLAFRTKAENSDLRRMPEESKLFLKRYSKRVWLNNLGEIDELFHVYSEARNGESETRRPLVIPS